MELKPGLRLRSTVSDVEVVVIAGSAELDLTCGGAPMVDTQAAAGPPAASAPAGPEGEVLLGKRYVNTAATLELLCTKAGGGTLAAGGEPLELKTAKPLPSSD